jgi:hypothetical protein
MMDNTKNNYIRSSGTGPTWKVDIDPLPIKFDNYFIESCRAAEEIYSQKQGKVHVMYSGGIDSEHCLNVFLHLGMDVTPVIIKLNPGHNDHDTAWAFKFCESKNIVPLVIDIDFDHFVKSGKMFEVQQTIKSKMFARTWFAYAAEQLPGTVIFGDGEPHIVKYTLNNKWYLDMYEYEFTVSNYFQSKGIHGTANGFSCYTSEQMASFLVDPRINQLATNQIPHEIDSDASKNMVYNRHSNFNLKTRPKYYGYEYLKESKLAQEAFAEFMKIIETGKQWDGKFFINYHNLIKDIENV